MTILKQALGLLFAALLLSSLVFVDVSYAAGRVFYDGFEDGTTNKWSQDDFRNKCAVVSSALDGRAGPRSGTRMLRCNWNGTVAWNNSASFETLVLRTWSYSTEFLIRYWIRTDSDFGGLTGPKYYRIGSDSSGATNSYGGLQVAGVQTAVYYNATSQIGNTFWGAGSRASNGSWHKVEIYIKQHGTSGIVRLWEDGVKLWEAVNVNTLPGGSWNPFYISSNWSGAPGCCDHDANNHLYWDEFEIYSDTGSGATGSMSDATINVGSGSGSQTVPNAPSGLQLETSAISGSLASNDCANRSPETISCETFESINAKRNAGDIDETDQVFSDQEPTSHVSIRFPVPPG